MVIGRTDLDVAISNECGRLVANIVIAYNSFRPLTWASAERNWW
jgi:hypothetical protein